jgi:hypothetical protein
MRTCLGGTEIRVEKYGQVILYMCSVRSREFVVTISHRIAECGEQKSARLSYEKKRERP